MAPRANWKGFLKIAEVSCPVALYTATSPSERITLHTLNRATGTGTGFVASSSTAIPDSRSSGQIRSRAMKSARVNTSCSILTRLRQ